VSRQLLVVGAGPAGVSAALWARSLGIDALVIDGGSRVGGQLHDVHFRPVNVAGVEDDGPAIAARLASQLAAAQVALRLGVRAAALEPGERTRIRTADGERLEAAALLIATGVRRRHLEVPGDRELEGRGVFYADRPALSRQNVAVVGGGDAAFENALLLAEACCRVTLLVRGRARARAEFQSRAQAAGITRHDGARVLAIVGADRVRSVRVDQQGSELSIEVQAVLVQIGVQPNTEWCRDVLAHDDEGYLRVDATGATSVPGVWAAGDVTRPALLGVTVAAGQGALAVAAIRKANRERDLQS
jgi:thioredoxin reductase (NADPH)